MRFGRGGKKSNNVNLHFQNRKKGKGSEYLVLPSKKKWGKTWKRNLVILPPPMLLGKTLTFQKRMKGGEHTEIQTIRRGGRKLGRVGPSELRGTLEK